MEMVQLRNHELLPVVGAGMWKITDKEQMREVVREAWQYGYRLFDTAAAYCNEIVLGKALNELHLPRKSLILQDKLWTTCYGYENTQAACKRSLKKLKTEYLDVYLIHWPITAKQHENWEEINAETWRGMEKLYTEGYVKTIGVCNFNVGHLAALIKSSSISPMLNQVECHPGMYDRELTEYCLQQGIQLQAASPLGNGQLLNNAELKEMAAENHITVAQLCLKWGVQHGYIVLPKTTKAERLKENISLDNIKLDDEVMQRLDNLPFCGGLAIDSDEVNKFDGL